MEIIFVMLLLLILVLVFYVGHFLSEVVSCLQLIANSLDGLYVVIKDDQKPMVISKAKEDEVLIINPPFYENLAKHLQESLKEIKK